MSELIRHEWNPLNWIFRGALRYYFIKMLVNASAILQHTTLFCISWVVCIETRKLLLQISHFWQATTCIDLNHQITWNRYEISWLRHLGCLMKFKLTTEKIWRRSWPTDWVFQFSCELLPFLFILKPAKLIASMWLTLIILHDVCVWPFSDRLWSIDNLFFCFTHRILNQSEICLFQ